MKEWVIYGKDGVTEKCRIKKLEYSGEFMGQCSVTVSVSSPTPIHFELGDYLEYRGERFELNYDPTVQKQASSGMYGEGFVYDNVVFHSLSDELTRCDFLDYVLDDNLMHYSALPTFSFFAENVKALADRIQANLNRVYKGDKSWTVTVHPEYKNDANKNVSVSNQTVWDALGLVNSLFGANFIVKNRTITIGTKGLAVGNLFSYGKGNGLYQIEKNAESEQKIITRLRAYGSTKNMPSGYYHNKEGWNVPNNMAVNHLMLPSFPAETLDPYIDSKYIDELGVREGTVFFDGSGDQSEIYPTMTGMTAEELKAAGVNVNATGALDEVFSAELIADNGKFDVAEGESSVDVPSFTVTLKDVGFDINDNLGTSNATLSMKDGMCGGREFEIVKCEKQGNNYVLTCNRYYDSSLDLYFPYKDYQIKSGDKFTLLGIEMPDVYVQAASQRLLEAAKTYLANNDFVRYGYTLSVDNVFIARQHDEAIRNGEASIHDVIKEGDLMLFEDVDLGIDGSITIDSLSIKEDYENSLIPEYEITLKDNKTVGTIQKLQNQVTSILNGSSGGSVNTDQVKSIVEAVGGARFLSKTKDDRSKGVVASDKGFQAGEFVSGAIGVGVYQNEDGQWVIETDNLSVRRRFSANEVEIQTMNHIGGQTMLTAARMVVEQVEELSDRYRCSFRKKDGEGNVIRNEWKVGDQAFCNTFNLEVQADGTIGNHYYWREVVGISSDEYYHYVELSKDACASGSSNPKAGDKVVQLGYTKDDDANRQNAIIIAGAGTGSPYIQVFEGIRNFQLPEPDQIKPGDNRLSGRLTIKAGSKGWENLEGLKDTLNAQVSNLEQFANAVTKEFENIRNEMDGAIDTWFGDEVPTMDNYPANEWATDSDKDSHLGDLYYASSGKAYRFQYTESEGYYWAIIEDSEVAKALEMAQNALHTADKKCTVFIVQPTPPYQLGDLWVGGENHPLMRCVKSRESGSFFESDWDLADNSQKYADAVKAELKGELDAVSAGVDASISNAVNVSKGYTDDAKADIQATIDELNTLKANAGDVYAKAVVDGMISDAEAEAIRQANEVATAQRALLETKVNAYADGHISEAEQRAIDEAERLVEVAKSEFHTSITTTKAEIDQAIADAELAMTSYTDEAKSALQASINTLQQAKANVDDVYNKTIMDGKVSALETYANEKAKGYADAAQELAEANVKAWADGEIDAAEARAIADAEDKLASAKAELEEAIRAATPEGYYEFVASVTQNFENLQEQIDGALDSYFDSYEPTLQNAPASEWTIDAEKEAHLNDTFTNLADGRSWRWTYNNGYQWTEILDTATAKALALAGQAQQTADKKRRVFVATPTAPYDKGDLWTGGKDTYLMVCVNPKLEGQAFAASDWDYADSAKKTKEELEALVASTKSNIDNAISQAKNEATANANSYTDEGKAALQASINALNETKANISNVYLKASEDDTISDVEARALAAAQEYAKAAIGLTDITVKAYADGIVSAEEQARIEEAQQNLATAKKYAEDKANEAFNNAEDLVDNLEGGKDNLLRNTGFFGDYTTASLLGEVVLSDTSEMYSPSLVHWVGNNATAIELNESESGKGVQVRSGGSLTQTLYYKVMEGESYVFSFRGKGTSITFSVGGYVKNIALGSDLELRYDKFTASEDGEEFKIEVYGDCTLCELQLERGTIRSAWGMSPLDNRTTLAQYESLTYLSQAIKDGSSEFAGGLSLANLMFAKDFENNITAGMSGVHNDEHSVAFFAGGDYNKAIATALTYASNPNYQASESEIQNMAKFVVTHGGRAILNDVVLRGYIYALGGLFKGAVEVANGKIKLNNDGSGHFASGNVSWGENGVMYRKSNDVVMWTDVLEYTSGTIDFRYGTYIDLTGYIDYEYVLENPNSDEYVITLKYEQPSRSSACATLSGSFRIVSSTELIDSTTSASHLKLGKSNKEFVLHYKGGNWYYYGNDAYIDEYGVAILGRSVNTTTEIEANVVQANSFYADGSKGLTKSISIATYYTRHTLSFKGGILVGYESEDINNGN